MQSLFTRSDYARALAIMFSRADYESFTQAYEALPETISHSECTTPYAHSAMGPVPAHAANTMRPAMPTEQEYGLFCRQVLTAGFPTSALPVESFYKTWSSTGAQVPFGRTGKCYGGDSAQHMLYLFDRFGFEVPEEFKAMPDHLSCILALLAELEKANRSTLAHSLAADHLDWISDYREKLDSVRTIADEQAHVCLKAYDYALSIISKEVDAETARTA